MKSLTTKTDISPLESALIQNDLSKMTADQRSSYYMQVCQSLGLNHLTQPFGYITFKGQMKLYAKKDCTDQLRAIHKISVEVTKQEKVGDAFIVTARATRADGRYDEDIGAVYIAKLNGDDLPNAYMKAFTKAKRRATLSICGLGFLDESEVETIKDAKLVNQPVEALPPAEAKAIEASPEPMSECDQIKDHIENLLLEIGDSELTASVLRFMSDNHNNVTELRKAEKKLEKILKKKGE